METLGLTVNLHLKLAGATELPSKGVCERGGNLNIFTQLKECRSAREDLGLRV